jgi:hypothetical protein
MNSHLHRLEFPKTYARTQFSMNMQKFTNHCQSLQES